MNANIAVPSNAKAERPATTQRLVVWYQPRADTEWRPLKELIFLLKEPVQPVPQQFVRGQSQPK